MNFFRNGLKLTPEGELKPSQEYWTHGPKLFYELWKLELYHVVRPGAYDEWYEAAQFLEAPQSFEDARRMIEAYKFEFGVK